MKVKLLQDYILVEFINPTEKTFGGLVIPRMAKSQPNEAIVLQIGPTKVFDNGAIKIQSVFPRIGDRVLANFVGQALDERNENIRIIKSSDILAIRKEKLMAKESHFKHAKKAIKSWPKWKREISLEIPKAKFNVDGILYKT
jgi:chaperonin GroES